jgi:hypothetical protein
VRLPGTSPWHLETLFLILLAANMKFHGTSPWYLFDFLCKEIRANKA